MNKCGKYIVISFLSKEGYYFVFNVYMLCLSQLDNDVKIGVVKCLSFIHSVNKEFVRISGVYGINIIIAGDFITSLHNLYKDNRLNAPRSLINDLSLVCCDDVPDVGYMFYNETQGYESYIDHIFISVEYKQRINSIKCNFGYENYLLFNAKKSSYFSFEDLFVRARKPEKFISKEKK